VELISDELSSVLAGWRLDVVPTLAEARQRIGAHVYDLFVLDFRLPDGDGIQLLREIRGSGLTTPTLFVTTAASAKLAVEAMKLGADDYIVKEEGYLSVLPYLVQEVLQRHRLAAERRVLEERLQRAERAATLGYLASGLAHHINNPLATIPHVPPAAAAAARRRGVLHEVPRHGARRERAHSRSREGHHARRDGARRRSRGPASRGDPRARRGERRDGSPREADRLPEGAAPETPPVRVHGEAATCLFLSLLQNAVRFSPEGGEIEVRARVDEATRRLVAVVRDHGPGIPPQNREKIFEPFFSTAVDGLGMGLFVASRIADLQNILLSVDTASPSGAAFKVELPLADTARG
jgi:signal transduction histidine kinase